MAETKKEAAEMDAKKMLKDAANSNRKVKYGERMKLIVIKDAKFHKKGQVIEPHTVMGERLVEDKIAAKFTPELAKKIAAEVEASENKK